MVPSKRLSLFVLLMFCFAAIESAPAFAGKLTDAVKARDVALVHSLLAAGEDVQEKVRGDYPLNVASLFGPVDTVVALLEAGADIEQPGRDGLHPLHNAVVSGHPDIVALLIKRGAKVDAKDTKGRTQLLKFAITAGSDIGIAKMLLAAGADPELEDTVEHQNSLHFAAINGEVDLGKILVEAHADINGRDGSYWGDTALGLATYHHRNKFIEWLITAGVDINLTNKQGQTPLQKTRYGRLRDLETEQILVDAGGK